MVRGHSTNEESGDLKFRDNCQTVSSQLMYGNNIDVVSLGTNVEMNKYIKSCSSQCIVLYIYESNKDLTTFKPMNTCWSGGPIPPS